MERGGGEGSRDDSANKMLIDKYFGKKNDSIEIQMIFYMSNISCKATDGFEKIILLLNIIKYFLRFTSWYSTFLLLN